MTSRELVRAAIAHQETDRVPYCIGYTADGASELRRLIGEQDVEEFTDNDVVRLSPPWWNWRDLAADWGAPQTPVSRSQVSGAGSYAEFFDTLKRWRDRTGKYLLATIYGSHFEKANFARGIENFLACPEVDGVLLGSDWGTQLDLLMSPDAWQDMIRPGEQKEYGLVHAYDKDVWIHSCGNVERIIPSLIEMGADVLNPVQPEAMDLQELKSAFGSRLTFWGGISTQKTLPYGTPAEVREESRRVRDLMAQGGGFVFAPAQEIQGDVPAENILALLEVAKEERGA